jgi:hypothetical protein
MALPVDVAGLRPRLGDVEAPPKPRSSLSSIAEAEPEPLGQARRSVTPLVFIFRSTTSTDLST